jgi:predicted RNA-binding protein with PIN domain
MPYIIDGHNLIGKLPGIQLSDPEDERQLAQELQAFAHRTRRRLTVYFDRGTPGGRDVRAGLVTLKFVSGRTADQAIAAHLRSLGGEASNWTVVTSDREVQAEARAAGAKVISSEAFAGMLGDEDGDEDGESPPGRATPNLSEGEIAEWEALFSRRKGDEHSSKT